MGLGQAVGDRVGQIPGIVRLVGVTAHGGQLPDGSTGSSAVTVGGDYGPVVGGTVGEGTGVAGGAGNIIAEQVCRGIGGSQIDVIGHAVARVRVSPCPRQVSGDGDAGGAIRWRGAARRIRGVVAAHGHLERVGPGTALRGVDRQVELDDVTVRGIGVYLQVEIVAVGAGPAAG